MGENASFKGYVYAVGEDTAWLVMWQTFPCGGPEIEFEVSRNKLPEGYHLGNYVSIHTDGDTIIVSLLERKWTADEIDQARERATQLLAGISVSPQPPSPADEAQTARDTQPTRKD